MALGAILERIWTQVRGQVGAKLAPKSIKMESKMTSKKEVVKKRGDPFFGEIWGGLGPQVGGQVGAKLAPKSQKWGSQDDVNKK